MEVRQLDAERAVLDAVEADLLRAEVLQAAIEETPLALRPDEDTHRARLTEQLSVLDGNSGGSPRLAGLRQLSWRFFGSGRANAPRSSRTSTSRRR
jgi:hypothetical protein